MRIIGGTFRSRKLAARVPGGTRPTSDRLRETLFNILGPRVLESVFLDAYAGTGAVGIEAISRGAGLVLFAERSGRASNAIRRNLASLEIREGYRIFDMDVERALAICRRERMHPDLVFLDPPYSNVDLYTRDLERVGSVLALSRNASVIVEHSATVDLPERAGALRKSGVRRQGTSGLSFYELDEGADPEARVDPDAPPEGDGHLDEAPQEREES